MRSHGISSIDLHKADGCWSFRYGGRIVSLSRELDDLIDSELSPFSLQSGIFLVASFDRIIYDSAAQGGLRLMWLEMDHVKNVGFRICYHDEDLNLDFTIPVEILMILGMNPNMKKFPNHLYIGIYSYFPVSQSVYPYGLVYEEDKHDLSFFKRDM